MSGTNYFTTIAKNSNVLVALTNKGDFAELARLQNTITLPTDTEVFARGCQLVVELTGAEYINTAADGLTPTWVNSTGNYTATGTLSSAEILTLFSAPTQVLPAPGAGFAYLVTYWKFKMDAGLTPYTIFPNSSLRILNTGTTTIWGSIQQNGFLTSVIDTTRFNNIGGLTGFVAQDNIPLRFEATGGDPTLGNGTMDYEINYQIIEL